jgi:hypothetical protein
MVFLPSHQDHWIHVVVFLSLSFSFFLTSSFSFILSLSFFPSPSPPSLPFFPSFGLYFFLSLSIYLSIFLLGERLEVEVRKSWVDGLLSAGYFYFSFQCYCSDRMISNGFATKQESRTKILLLLKRSSGKYFPDISWQVLVLWTFILKKKKLNVQ